MTRPGAPNPYPPDWKLRRAYVLTRDRRVCHWCGGYANSADHVTPIDAGGGHDLTNLVASCTPCNSRRSAESNGWSARPSTTRRRRTLSGPVGVLAPTPPDQTA